MQELKYKIFITRFTSFKQFLQNNKIMKQTFSNDNSHSVGNFENFAL